MTFRGVEGEGSRTLSRTGESITTWRAQWKGLSFKGCHGYLHNTMILLTELHKLVMDGSMAKDFYINGLQNDILFY